MIANQIVRGDVLEDERSRTGLDGVEEGVFVLADRKNDDPRRRQFALDALRRLDAAGAGSEEVHQNDVRRQLDR